MYGHFGRLSASSFGKLSPGLAGSPNTASTRPNRCQVLDGQGDGFAVRRVTLAVIHKSQMWAAFRGEGTMLMLENGHFAVAGVLASAVLTCACAGQDRLPKAEEVKEGFIESVDGVELFYRVYGSGEDTLFVVHGGPGLDHHYLLPDLEALKGSHTLITYDQRGSGRSTVVSDASLLHLDAHLADLEAVRQHFGIERAAFLGHSWGSMLTARYALSNPEHVSRLVLVSPGPIRKSPYDEEFLPRVTAWMGDAELAELESLRGAFADPNTDIRATCTAFFALFKRGYFHDSDDPEIVQRLRGDFCTGSEEGIRNLWTVNSLTVESLGNHDWRDDFREVDIPVLVITGTSDILPEGNVREWEAAFPNAELMLVEDAGHYPHVEQPEPFFNAIEEFLSGREIEQGPA
jgi:proline iminopeptidase